MRAQAQGPAAARVTVAATREVLVSCSRGLLARAITNLVDNAVKFTHESGRVDVSVSSTGRVAQIMVKDDGIGMTDAEAAHAFDRFWRTQDARSTPGFGLGLPLSSSPCLGTSRKPSADEEALAVISR